MGETSQHADHRASASPTPRFTRRMLAGASAGFAAALAHGGAGRSLSPAIAQGSSTQAGEWSPPEGVGGEAGYLQFEAELPFRAIAPHWTATAGVNAAVEIAVSEDGYTFSEPVIMGPANTDAGPPDREGRTFGQLMMTDASRFVRYRGLDANGNQITIPGLTFTYINAVGGPTLGDISTAPFPDTLSRPPIITREQWGAALAYDGVDAGASAWTPEYQRVEHIIIHHSTTPSFRDSLVEIRSIHYYHAVTRGWGDIGYNFLVDYLGNVFEGRQGGENVVGGHAFQYAYGSSGICSMGDFSVETSTPEAIGALVWISAWVGRKLDPLGRADFHETPNLPTICGHRDVNASTCPGNALWADLRYIRSAVAEVIAGSPDSMPVVTLAPGNVIQTVVSNANLRSKPDIDAPIDATLPSSTILTIVEGPTTNDGYIWYRVSGEQSAGWLATDVFTASSADPPVREYSDGDKVEIATSLLNIRSEPGLYSDIVATMTTGDTAHVIGLPETSDGIVWIHVDTALGTGWVAAQYIAPAGRSWIGAAFSAGDIVEVDTNALSLRADASTGSSQIDVLWTGTFGVVIDGPRRSTGYVWLKIRTDAGSGWVAEQYLSEPSSDPAPDERFSIGDEVIVDTDALNLRSVEGLDGTVLAVAYFGTPATIVDGPVSEDGYAWYRIETPDRIGWAVDEFLAPAGGASATASGYEPGTSIVVTTDALNLRDTASTSGSVITTLNNGDTGIVVDSVGHVDGFTWIEARFGDQSGYVATPFVGRSIATPSSSANQWAGTVVRASSDNVNIRARPSLSANVVGQVFSGDVLTIVDGSISADGYTWFKVEGDRWTGWTVSHWLQAAIGGEVRTGSTVRVIDGELNLRAGPSVSDRVIRLLPEGAVVEVFDGPEIADGYTWYRVSSSRYGTGWSVAAWLESA